MQKATFKWEPVPVIAKENELTHIKRLVFTLSVQRFDVKTNTIIGVTGGDGSGKSSLVHALLGHMPLRTGEYSRTGAISYYPERPYMMEDCTIRQNVLLTGNSSEKIDEMRYKGAVATVRLYFRHGFDSVPLGRSALDMQWLQRISLVRALYENKYVYIDCKDGYFKQKI